MKNNKKYKRILALAIVAVIFIPMLYSSVYLGAFWDPYGRLDKVPVAFVNLDKPVTKDGNTFAIGKELKKRLKETKKVAWKFVSHEEAEKGVEGSKYYALVEIPRNFSQKIADSKDENFKIPTIVYQANKGKNFVFSQISERVAESIKQEISSSVQKEVSEALVDNLYDLKVSIGEAGDGANKIKDGTKKLLEGSQSLTNGVGEAANGSMQLEAGLESLANGETEVIKGVNSLITGLNNFKASVTKTDPGIPILVADAENLADTNELLEEGVAELNKAVASLAEGADQIKNFSDGISASYEVLDQEREAINNSNLADNDKLILIGMLDNMEKINDENLSDKAGAIKAGIGSVQTDLANLQAVTEGAKKVSDGVNSLAIGLADSQNNAVKGLDQLIAGANNIQAGNKKILTGLNAASQKTGTLSDGLQKLNEGSVVLNSGIDDADKGILKLSNGLNKGYSELNDNVNFKAKDMAKYVAKPVTLTNKSINDVKYYGEGLAPYFISLSLWLGAMFINLIISLVTKFNCVRNKYLASFIGKFIFGALITGVQSLILSLVLLEALKINVTSSSGFYLANLLISIVFFAMMYGLSHAIGIISTPIIFIVFLLQLSSSGGTFPIETAPELYKIIGSVFPMTYSIGALRMIISGINSIIMERYITIMLIFMWTFLIGGFIIRCIIDFIKGNMLSNRLRI